MMGTVGSPESWMSPATTKYRWEKQSSRRYVNGKRSVNNGTVS